MNAYDPQNGFQIVHHVVINDNKTTCNLHTKDFPPGTAYSRNWESVTCEDCKKAGSGREKILDSEKGNCTAYLDLPDGRRYCHIDSNHEGLHYDNNYDQAFGVVVDDKSFSPGGLGRQVPTTEQSGRVAQLANRWFNEFRRKSEDYQTSTGNVSENFGLMGQYMKLTDKIHKLRRPMWDNEILRQATPESLPEFNFESTEEILRDIIGHCFLALDFMEQRDER